jgi:hypothetical protein
MMNKLTLIKRLGPDKTGQQLSLFKCSCGKEKIIRHFRGINGETKSCGCARADAGLKQRGEKNDGWKGYKEISGTLWGRIQICAKKRGLEFNVTIQHVFELLEKQNFRCALTGLDIHLSDYRTNVAQNGSTASLDRIDSTKGYVEGNLQWVHRVVNTMKTDLSEKEFVEFCMLVVMHNSLKTDGSEGDFGRRKFTEEIR